MLINNFTEHVILLMLLVTASCIGVVLAIVAHRRAKLVAKLRAKLAESEIRLTVANERVAERDLLFQNLQSQFENLSAKALKDNNAAFLSLAKNSFESLTKEASSEFDHAVKPIGDTLKIFDEKLQNLEKQRQTAYVSLAEQLKMANLANVALQEETNNLRNALRRPDIRGQWGEMQLRRTVELAGMIEHVDFSEQANAVSDDGQHIRPDMVIHLPNSRTIVVDAKAPLAGYLEAMSVESKTDQRAAFDLFSAQIKRHIDKLSAKSYWQQFQNCPEFVILFLPGENFLSDAFRANPELLEYAVSRKVILAAPTTLIALLKAISYGWKQSQLAEEAREIANVGQEMYARLKVFFEHFNTVGKSIYNSVDAFNKMRASANSRLLPIARRFQSLGTDSAEIKIIPKIDMEEP